jgi:hypothetical protein
MAGRAGSHTSAEGAAAAGQAAVGAMATGAAARVRAEAGAPARVGDAAPEADPEADPTGVPAGDPATARAPAGCPCSSRRYSDGGSSETDQSLLARSHGSREEIIRGDASSAGVEIEWPHKPARARHAPAGWIERAKIITLGWDGPRARGSQQRWAGSGQAASSRRSSSRSGPGVGGGSASPYCSILSLISGRSSTSCGSAMHRMVSSSPRKTSGS